MTRTRTVIWKEWHEYRWLVWTGLCAFVFTPLVGSLLEYATHAYSVNLGREISSTAASVLLAFGGLFAVLLGVGNTCRDLRPQLLGFWQSRPIGIGRPLATKYLVGLAVLLFVCGIVLTVYAVLFAGGDATSKNYGAVRMLLSHTFTLIAVYSTSFLLGCLIRHTAQAAIVSVGAGLLIYFLPMVLPPLGRLSIFNLLFVSDGRKFQTAFHGDFVAGMLTISALSVLLAYVAVKRDWRLRTDQRLIVWSLGAVFIILFAGGAFQLGSNLTSERQIDLRPAGALQPHVRRAVINNGRGVVLLGRHQRRREDDTGLRTFDLSQPNGALSPAIWLVNRPTNATLYPILLTSPQPLSHAYVVLKTWQDRKVTGLDLCTVAIDDPRHARIIHKLDLLPDGDHVTAHRHSNTIYIASRHRIRALDVRNPARPVVTADLKFDNRFRLERTSAPDGTHDVYHLKLGHYASPREWFHTLSILSDGRIAAVGQGLHILTPPEAR